MNMDREAVYTEHDMLIARNALEKLKAENKNLMAIIWALVIGQGGQACINQNTLLEAFDKRNELVTWDDPVSCSTFVKARRPVKDGE
jgi:hypothetical protein